MKLASDRAPISIEIAMFACALPFFRRRCCHISFVATGIPRKGSLLAAPTTIAGSRRSSLRHCYSASCPKVPQAWANCPKVVSKACAPIGIV